MKAIKCQWFKIDWNAYWNDRGDCVIDSGEFYAVSEDRARELCPITPVQGKIYFEEIEILS